MRVRIAGERGRFLYLLEKAGSADEEAVRLAIEARHCFVGTGCVVNMSAEEYLGLDLSAFRMLEFQDGDWVLVV